MMPLDILAQFRAIRIFMSAILLRKRNVCSAFGTLQLGRGTTVF